jgi:peptidyl-Asp metalloendopeptidase
MKALLAALLLSTAPLAVAMDDALIPPVFMTRMKPATVLAMPVNPNELITIDLMILHTAGLAQDTLETLITDANRIYRDSAVNINLRIVHSQQIDYTEYSSNTAALLAMTYATAPSFYSIPELRDEKKADLVVLIRPFHYAAQLSCGVAWLLGAGEQALSIPAQSDYGYSVVSYGADGRYSCTPFTLIHELGHNMGLSHDRANANSPGAFPYAYGYAVPGAFNTVMAYGNQRIGRFSSPDQVCVNGLPCGTDDANNVRALNEIRQTIAGFRN